VRAALSSRYALDRLRGWVAAAAGIDGLRLCEEARQRGADASPWFFIIIYRCAVARGRPFYYYVRRRVSAEIDGFTGHTRCQTDILQDVGDSISPIVDRGQIEGGFLQGLGWLTIEELLWDGDGRVSSAGASTYKLPSWSEMPEIFNVTLLERATQPGVILGSKAVGEPPLMLAISVREALRDAVGPSRATSARSSL
jgi:xanthine dehydrogenase large subunit